MQSDHTRDFLKESNVLLSQTVQSSSTQHGNHHIPLHRPTGNSNHGGRPGAVATGGAGIVEPDELLPKQESALSNRLLAQSALQNMYDPFVSSLNDVLGSVNLQTRSDARSGDRSMHITDMPTGTNDGSIRPFWGEIESNKF